MVWNSGDSIWNSGDREFRGQYMVLFGVSSCGEFQSNDAGEGGGGGGRLVPPGGATPQRSLTPKSELPKIKTLRQLNNR